MTDNQVAESKPPKRTLDKQEAIRHLIHGAVRLVIAAEDPFVIHMLVQSADKMLIDLSEKTGKKLAFEWTEFIRPEKVDFFFARFREIYNFFKHADKDFSESLPVHDIATFNVISLFVAIQNYQAVFGKITSHMALLNMFVQAIMPGIFTSEMTPERLVVFEAGLKGIANMTPRVFFSITTEFKRQFSPNFDEEWASDTQDVRAFYAAKFSSLQNMEAGTK